MLLKVERKPEKFHPNFKRVILRFLYYSDDRARTIIKKVLEMPDDEIMKYVELTLRDFSRRHRSVTRSFLANFDRVAHVLPPLNIVADDLSQERKLIIGSYFTMEYSIESAAFFNPAIVESNDQFGLEEGTKRIILSFRAIGEGHISSIVFRQGIIDKNCNFQFETESHFVRDAEIIRHHIYDKKEFVTRVNAQNAPGQLVPAHLIDASVEILNDTFMYRQLEASVGELMKSYAPDSEDHHNLERVLWSADVYHEINFSYDTDISERVIFPVTMAESNGIEDARFVRFTDEDGSITFYATYTAYNGSVISPKIL